MKKRSKARNYHKHPSQLNPAWVREAREDFRKFLNVTPCPHPVRNGTRGSTCDDPEWLLMFMARVAVKADATSYLALPRLAVRYGDIMAERLDLKPIPESTLRTRLKNICHAPRRPAGCMFQVCPRDIFDEAGECRQHDVQRQRTGLASATEDTRPCPQRAARAGPAGQLGESPRRWLDLGPRNLQPHATSDADCRALAVEVECRP
jgi:hypothetical protein